MSIAKQFIRGGEVVTHVTVSTGVIIKRDAEGVRHKLPQYKTVPGWEIVTKNAHDQADILYHLNYFNSAPHSTPNGRFPNLPLWEHEMSAIKKEGGSICNAKAIVQYCTDNAAQDTGADEHEEKDSWFESLKSKGSTKGKARSHGLVATHHKTGKGRHHTANYDDDFDDDDDGKNQKQFNVPKQVSAGALSEYASREGLGTTDVYTDRGQGFDDSGTASLAATKHLYDDDDVSKQ
jgi:hypothetical protein